MRRVALGKGSMTTCKKLCRQLVVECRDGNVCQRCGRGAGKIDWAHVVTRSDPSLICVPWNPLALCGPRINQASCHNWFDNNKIASIGWWEETFPDRAEAFMVWRHAKKHRIPDRRVEAEWLRQEIRAFGGTPCC